MIIIRIFGGLGNQLFQYAAARALAEKHQTELKVDVTAFANYELRNFDLAKLSFPFSIASEKEIASLKATSSVERLTARMTPYSLKKFYKEPFFHYNPKFFQLPKDVYLQGYFQSEMYFSSIGNIVRNDFELAHLVKDPVRALQEAIQSSTSVALHIRKGDYKNPETFRVHGILPIDYYQEAIQYFKQNFSNPKFYLFSDDPEIAKKELNLPEAIVVSGEKTSSHFEDLSLMSCCQHNIIANSSFSWWGAWLNNNPDKCVLAPKKWFNEGPKDTQDLVPKTWITV